MDWKNFEYKMQNTRFVRCLLRVRMLTALTAR
jgi:hypothetical protein